MPNEPISDSSDALPQYIPGAPANKLQQIAQRVKQSTATKTTIAVAERPSKHAITKETTSSDRCRKIFKNIMSKATQKKP